MGAPPPAGAAPADERRAYRIPAGDAATTLLRFATVSGEQIVYLVENVRGERTNGISGRFTARDALERMIAGTELNASQDDDTGALVVGRRRPPTAVAAVPPRQEPSASGEGPLRRMFSWLTGPRAAAAATTLSSSPAPDPNAPIALEAFEVNTARDVGYTAASALAGGRIDSPLRDTPSAVSVMTRQFLDDIGATSVASAAEWATNALPVGDTVGGAGGEHNVNLRGLGSSFPSRNYFRWYVSSDSYNTERLEFARGPNAILFGDGNLGGINTTWTKQAVFAPLFSAQARVDSYGGHRSSIDANVVAGERLAVRLNALHDRLSGWRDHDDARRDSAHLAATFRFSADTQVRAEFEQGRYLRYAFAQNFVDQSSAWDGVTTYDGATPPASPAEAGLARFNTLEANDHLVWDPALGKVLNWRGFYQTTGTGLTLLPEGRDFPRFPALPSREFSLQPPDAVIDTRYRTWSFFWEHRFGRNLMAQAAYNRQEQSREGHARVWGTRRIDVNTVRPDGTPNPHLGRPFSEVNTNRLFRSNRIHDLRLSLAHRASLGALRHTLSVVSGWRNDVFTAFDYRVGRVNGAEPNAVAATNQLLVRQYWDAPRNPAMFDTLSSEGREFRWINHDGSVEDQTLFYNQIASASSLFDGRLSVLLGYRYDFYSRDHQREVATEPDGTTIPGGIGGPGTFDRTDLELDTLSAGAVWYPVLWAGPFLNYSESYNTPGNGAPRIGDRPIRESANRGVDAGLKLELLDGRIAGSVGYYWSRQVDRPRNGENLSDINEIWNDLGRPELALPSYRDTESYEGEGVELDLTANLTRNWRLMFNYARPRTAQREIGPGLRAYYTSHVETWRTGAADPALPNAARIAQNLADIESTLAGHAEGRTLNGTVDYTANFYTTYTFASGRLKGFGIGAGANLRGRQVVDSAQGAPFDYRYNRAYMLWSAHASYQRPLGRARVRYQVNVANLFDERSPVVQNFSFVPSAGRDFPDDFRYQNPRRITVSVTFER